MAISRSLQPRQQYGFGGIGKIFKKVTKPIKKIVKSPIGKAALLGAGLYGLGGLKSLGGSGMFTSGQGLSRFGNIAQLFGKKGKFGNLLYSGKGADRAFSMGKAGLLGLLGAGTIMPFLGGKDDEEEDEGNWWEPSEGISALRNQAKNYYTSATPDYKGSPFMPQKQYVMPNFYAAHGGRAGLLNGGEAGQAQAEQMLRMQYQKYRNQGGTMSYQQFKMAVLQQAQGQGPMAQAANGGRIGYNRGRVVNPGGYAGWKTSQPDLSDRHSLYPFFKNKQISDGRRISPPPGDISWILELMRRNKAEGGRIGYAFGKGPILDPDAQEGNIPPFARGSNPPMALGSSL